MSQVIFFDIDGTLIDHAGAEKLGVLSIFNKYKKTLRDPQEEEFYNIWLRASEKHNKEYLRGNLSFKEQRIKRLQEVFLHFQKSITEDEALRIFFEYLDVYEASWKCFDDVIPCLKNLKEHQLGIISNGDKAQQIKKLKIGGVFGYFRHFIISSEAGFPKPDRKIFDFACRKANVLPENAVYIGDNLETDIEPAKNIGMQAVLIDRECRYSTGYNKINTLKQLNLD